jgi:hypothetical protein
LTKTPSHVIDLFRCTGVRSRSDAELALWEVLPPTRPVPVRTLLWKPAWCITAKEDPRLPSTLVSGPDLDLGNSIWCAVMLKCTRFHEERRIGRSLWEPLEESPLSLRLISRISQSLASCRHTWGRHRPTAHSCPRFRPRWRESQESSAVPTSAKRSYGDCSGTGMNSQTLGSQPDFSGSREALWRISRGLKPATLVTWTSSRSTAGRQGSRTMPDGSRSYRHTSPSSIGSWSNPSSSAILILWT